MDLAHLQDVIERTYGDRDRERGVPSTVAWLAEEVGELAQAVRKGDHAQRVHEFADVLAWVASLANQVGVDLTEAVQRYADGCPRCSVGALLLPPMTAPGQQPGTDSSVALVEVISWSSAVDHVPGMRRAATRTRWGEPRYFACGTRSEPGTVSGRGRCDPRLAGAPRLGLGDVAVTGERERAPDGQGEPDDGDPLPALPRARHRA